MNWKEGYSARYYVTFVDPDSWGDTKSFEITGGSIINELTNLRASADLDCVNYSENRERIIRVWLDTNQKGSGEHIPLFTGYTSSPDRTIEGRKETQTLQCYSALLPASDILLDRGWYAPIHSDGITIVKSLLSCTNSPVEISQNTSENRILSQSVIAESGETRLSMADKIISALNWRIVVDGYGRTIISPIVTEPVANFDARSNDIIEPSLQVSYDWFNCPNVIRCVMDDQVAIYCDEDPDSIISVYGRGREIWYEETDCILNNDETLKSYAKRRLAELQRVAYTVSYTRRFIPNIYTTDMVSINYPEQDLTGNFVITSQNISLGYSPKVSEEVAKI